MPDDRTSTVDDKVIDQLERFREHLSATDPRRRIPLRVAVHHVELTEESDEGSLYRDEEIVVFEQMPSVIELLEIMGDRPLREQVYMICNLLTISGFTQSEIAQELGVAHQKYRNTLLRIRKDMKALMPLE